MAPRRTRATQPRTIVPATDLPVSGNGPVCDACGQELVEIGLLIDGEKLTMRSCGGCDRRSWHRGAEQVDLGGVLADLSSTPTRYRRDLAGR
jgi:hypothetical protein